MSGSKTSRQFLLRLLIGGAVGFLLLGWLLYKAGWSEVVQSIRQFSPWAILLMIGITYVSLPLRAAQWKALLGHPAHLSWRQVFKALCVGYVGNGVLPAGGGELLRAYALTRSGNLSFARVLGSIVLIRLQDLLPVLLITTAVLGILPLTYEVRASLARLYPAAAHLPDTELHFMLRFMSLAGIAAILLLFVAFLHRKTARRVSLAVLGKISPSAAQKCEDVLTRIDSAVGALGHTRFLLEGQIYAVACWTIFLVAPIPLLMELGLASYQAFLTALAINGLATLALFIPIAPAGVGIYHTVCGFALLSFNPAMQQSDAVAYAVMSHLISLSPLALSLVFLTLTHSMQETHFPPELAVDAEGKTPAD